MLRHGAGAGRCVLLGNRGEHHRRQDGEHRTASAMRIGITFAAAEIWSFPKARSEATRVLLAVLPCTDESMAHAWRAVFNSPWPMADDCTRQILDSVCENRELLRVRHGSNLVDRMKELLERSLEPDRVCSVASALLEECGNAVGDIRTAWAASAGDLIDIAVTLQRLPGTSLCGLRLFERPDGCQCLSDRGCS